VIWRINRLKQQAVESCRHEDILCLEQSSVNNRRQQEVQKQQNKQVKFLTQKEVADRFRVSSGTIINWREKGQLKYFRCPGSSRVLYPIVDIDEFEQKFTKAKKEVIRPTKIKREKPEISAKPEKEWKI
jgi:hypothetical protein